MYQFSDNCRKYVLENNGLKVISDVVRYAVSLGDTDVGADLRACSVGFLLNFVAGNEDVYPMVIHDAIFVLKNIIYNFGRDFRYWNQI